MASPKRTSRKPKTAEVALVDESADSVAKRTLVVLFVTLGFVLLLLFLFAIREILLLLVIATVFALALGPLVGWLVKHGWPRVLSSIVAVVLTLVVLTGVIGAAASPLITQTTRLVNNFPQFIDDVSHNSTAERLNDKYHIVDKAKEAAKEAPVFFRTHQSSIVETARNTFGAIANVIIIIVLTIFLLLEGPKTWETLVTMLNPRYAHRVDRAGHQVAKGVGGYVSGNLFISLIAAIVVYVSLIILKVPYAFPLAVLVAIFDLIPLVGATLATVIVGLVALSHSVAAAIAIAIIIIIYQNVEGHIIQPIVYSRTVQLSPLLVLVATIVGATLGGIIGVLLAIPAASTAQVIILEVLSGTAPARRAHLRRT
jgi:predicted PurR-regulated permease PerM